jgi:predicted MFS family arabinose efflux permease
MAMGLAGAYGLLCLVPSPPLMAILMFGAGVCLAPMLTVSFVLVDRLAPRGTTTEAFAWRVTVFTSGTAVGAATAGAVLERSGDHWAAACGAVATIATALILYGGRRLLRHPMTPPRAAPAPEG